MLSELPKIWKPTWPYLMAAFSIGCSVETGELANHEAAAITDEPIKADWIGASDSVANENVSIDVGPIPPGRSTERWHQPFPGVCSILLSTEANCDCVTIDQSERDLSMGLIRLKVSNSEPAPETMSLAIPVQLKMQVRGAVVTHQILVHASCLSNLMAQQDADQSTSVSDNSL